jgi:hypothetical protein
MMTDQSRRKFLKATSIGGAAAGATVLLPRLSAQAATAKDGQAAAGSAAEAGAVHSGPFVAYVKDAKTGEIAVLAGEHEILHRDVQLARQLAQVAARTPRA